MKEDPRGEIKTYPENPLLPTRISKEAYIEDKLVAVKWRNWKYYKVWQPDPEKKAIVLPKYYLFNLILDPKEETPRSSLADGWLNGPITGIIKKMKSSLAEYPPIPFGAPTSYMPRRAAIGVRLPGSAN
jgi:hypothetical protein